MPAVEPEREQSEADKKDGGQDIIGAGKPRRQSDRCQHDCEKRGKAADRRDHCTNGAGCDEGAVTHVSLSRSIDSGFFPTRYGFRNRSYSAMARLMTPSENQNGEKWYHGH